MEKHQIAAVRAYYSVKRSADLGLPGRRWYVIAAGDGRDDPRQDYQRIVCKLDGYDNQAAALWAMEDRIQSQLSLTPHITPEEARERATGAARELEAAAYCLLADLTPEAIERAATAWDPDTTQLIRDTRELLLAAAEVHHFLDAHICEPERLVGAPVREAAGEAAP